MAAHVETLRWEGSRPGHVVMIEQTLLPLEERAHEVRTVAEMVDAIYRLAVRGAPAIGVAAAYGVLLGIQHLDSTDAEEVEGCAREAAATLAKSRPTAVNLFWALERMLARASRDRGQGKDGQALISGLFEEAMAIHAEDAAQCRRMGELGAELLSDGQTVLTHCNAGALATGGMGTALAPIYVAHSQGKTLRVFADETRPLLQGARLTAWELGKAGIEAIVITDNMAATVMRSGKIDRVIVGSDRIARNGDVCNKIGTYGVAVLAKHHGIPFTVVAPLSTFDPEVACGADIPIEERPREEITNGFGRQTTPDAAGVFNPAFDYTPAELVSEIVTEAGIIAAPDRAKVEALLRKAGRLA